MRVGHSDAQYRQLEEDILAHVQTLGIGSGGMGGVITALSVAIEAEPTHIAGMPLAVSINCWADRKAKVVYKEERMRNLTLPLSREDIASLSAYDQVMLSGKLYVGRDQVHRLLYGMIEQNETLPISLEERPSTTWVHRGARGDVDRRLWPDDQRPDGSLRPDAADRGLRVMVGKGPRSQAVIRRSSATRRSMCRPSVAVAPSMPRR